MGLLGKLVLKMSADSADFERNMKKAHRSAKSFGDQTQVAAGMAAKAMAAAGVAVGAAAVVIVKANLASIDSMAKTADQLGMNTKALAGYRHAAELTGVSQAGADKSLKKMIKSLGEAKTGIGTAKDYLDQMGLSAGALAAMRPEDSFAAIAEEINNLATQSDKAAAAQAIFGREGVALLNTMKLGKEGLAAAAAEAATLGLALSRVDAAKVEAANDAMTRMSAASAGFGKTLTVAVSPYIEEIAKELMNASLKSDGFRDQIATAMEMATNGVIMLGKGFYGLKLVWNALKYSFDTVSLAIMEGIHGMSKAVAAAVDFANIGGIMDSQLASINASLRTQQFIIDGIRQTREETLDAGAEALGQYEELEGNVRKYKAAILDASQAAAELVANNVPSATVTPKVIDTIASQTGSQEGAADPAGLAAAEAARATAENEAVAAKYAGKLAALDNYLADERDRLFNAAVVRSEMVLEADEAGLITEQTRNELLEKIAADHDSRLTAITQRGLKDREKFQDKSMKDQVKSVIGSLVQMTAGVAKENKAMFAINKAASMATAIMNTAEGATKTLAKYPGPLGVALAAVHVAAGLAQISQIASTSFGSSEAPSVAATGAGGVVQTVDPLESQDQNQDQQPAGIVYNLTVNGNVVDNDQFARETFDAFRRAENDGMDR